MVASLRLVKSLKRCLCCISSVFLVIQPIEKCSSVFRISIIARRWPVLWERFTITNGRPYIEVQRGLAVLISVNKVGTQSRVRSI